MTQESNSSTRTLLAHKLCSSYNVVTGLNCWALTWARMHYEEKDGNHQTLLLEVVVVVRIIINPLICFVCWMEGNWRNTEGKNVCLKRTMSINIKHFEHFPSFLQEDLMGSTNSLQTQLFLTTLLTWCPWLFNQFLKTKRNSPLVTLER